MRKSSFVAMLFALWVVLCLNFPAAATKYKALALRFPGGSGTVVANAINNAGQVVGGGYTSSGEYHAFLYSGGVMEDLGTLGRWGEAYGINASGQVVGINQIDTIEPPLYIGYHAFLHSGGVMQDLSSLDERSSFTYGINASGLVVGYAEVPWPEYPGYFVTHAFIYSGGVKQFLGRYPSEAYSINNFGQVVGNAQLDDKYDHAFLYSGGVMQDLGTLGGQRSYANAINDAGQVVGRSYLYHDLEQRPFIYSGGVMQDLGTLGGNIGEAYSINNSGQVVGKSNNRAFLYSGGVMRDLNGLVQNLPPGVVLTEARGINDRGWIAANDYTYHYAYLLVPVVSDPSPVLGLLLND